MLFLPKEVETVITTLQGAGYSPYLVGGCVREMLRGKAPSDYDMTSDALPQEVLRLFGEWAHPTGLQHGTVTVVSGGLPIELTTMRRDGAYRDNRHPDSVTFGTSIEEDLARRDFTVNAIALSPDGTLIDPFCGSGTILIEGAMLAMHIAPGLASRSGGLRKTRCAFYGSCASAPCSVFRRRRRPPAPRMRSAAYSPTLRMSACTRR